MSLNIKSGEADRLARELAGVTGESITEAVTVAVRERLSRERAARRSLQPQLLRSELRAIRERAKRIPRISDASPDTLLGYNEEGLWT